jgi:hypothetical protein
MTLKLEPGAAGRWPRLAIAGLALASLLLGGCATTPAPVEQIKYFSQAFASVNTVGQPLLDELAIAERAQGKRVAERRARDAAKNPPVGRGCANADAAWVETGDPAVGFVGGFCLEDAGYHATVGDPPATGQLRGGLRVIERYAEVLTTLAEGHNIDQAIGEVQALGQELGGLLAVGGLHVALAPALQALQPVLADVARNANAQEARRLIVEGAPKVSTLISALREAAPETFNVLVSELRRGSRASAGAGAAVKAIESRRVMVSQYVVLLGRLQQAWDATAAAAQNPGGSRLTDLVARTTQVRAEAEAVRRSLAALRMNNPAP